MNAQDIFEQVKASKKYRNIYEETILRICSEETPKYKKSKDVVKSVKNKLHQLSASFIKYDINSDKQDFIDSLEEAAKAHVSTSERMGFYKDLYGDIFGALGNIKSIMDIASGINPLLLIQYCRENDISLEALHVYDINLDAVELVNRACGLYDINGRAEGADLLISLPEQQADAALLFKIVPLLEQQRKGYYKEVISKLNVRYAAITFPTKTMSSKAVGMLSYYREFFKSYITESNFKLIFEKEYPNELLFIIDKDVAK